MVVRRVSADTPHGRVSDVEPELDQAWDDFDKLRWHAAVTALDTGLSVWVADMRGSDSSNDYSVQINTSTRAQSIAVGGFDHAWTLLAGISIGAQAITEERGGPPRH